MRKKQTTENKNPSVCAFDVMDDVQTMLKMTSIFSSIANAIRADEDGKRNYQNAMAIDAAMDAMDRVLFDLMCKAEQELMVGDK
jgi:hypothetical protein